MMKFRSAPTVLVLLLCLATPCRADESKAEASTVVVTQIQITGTHRTDPQWIKDYLDLNKCPCMLTSKQVTQLQNKLRTTDAFRLVTVAIVADPAQPHEKILLIDLQEKWTTIPVVRAAYGGGTPLTVIGMYDTNGLGKLWTFGAEARKYGNAPISGTVWARAPRWLQGNHVLGAEFWQENRIRTVYSKTIDPIGTLHTSYNMMRLLFMAPIFDDQEVINERWQLGLDIKLLQETPSRFIIDHLSNLADSREPIDYNSMRTNVTKAFASLVFDNIIIDHLNYDGLRFIFNTGPIFRSSQSKVDDAAELELFYYNQLADGLLFASHGFFSSTSAVELQDQYFIGGLDSIRGLPDGATYGSKVGYINLEVRKVIMKFKYFWIQTALFTDIGGAGATFNDITRDLYSSLGAGLRISCPYINRFMFRFDYAFSLNNNSLNGLNAGMNDFFQPYRPL